jgi:hypothetical protein
MSLPSLQSLLETAVEATRRFGPYVLTEVLLPGGTILALLLYLSRLRRARRARMLAEAAAAQPEVAPAPAARPVSRRARPEVLWRRARLWWLRRPRARPPMQTVTSGLGLAPRS